MRRYMVISFVVLVVFMVIVFMVAQEDTNLPFRYGLF